MHRRLGHIDNNKMIRSFNLYNGVPFKHWNGSVKAFRDFIAGKTCRQFCKSRDADHEMKHALDHLYSGVVGPNRVRSFSHLIRIFRHTDWWIQWIIILFNSKIARVKCIMHFWRWLKNWKSYLSAKSRILSWGVEKMIRWLLSDGAGEYICISLREWLQEEWIIDEIMTFYFPESNGSAERLSRTLLDMARTMIMCLHRKYRNRYWAEVINCAKYSRNRLHSRSCRDGMTPHEAVHGTRPAFSHVCVFGCRAFVHVPKGKRLGKFAPRTEERVFIGNDRGNLYRVIDPKAGTVTILKIWSS